jgi:hypothetical protein
MDVRTFILNHTALQNELKKAIHQADCAAVEIALKKGADPNWVQDVHKDSYLNTILYGVAQEDQLKIMELLFQYGCHVSFQHPECNILEEFCSIHSESEQWIANETVLSTAEATLREVECLERVHHQNRIESLLKAHGAIEPQALHKGPILKLFRYGFRNPEKIIDPLYYQLIASRKMPHEVRKVFGLPEFHNRFPPELPDIMLSHDPRCLIWHYGWRFGVSRTVLPDGSLILIAGEHEDYYDADFCIFNDVLKIDASGKMELYFYPTNVFPPTDFHTATSCDGDVILIGSVGYASDRQMGKTQVLRLKLDDFSIEPMHTSGTPPNWLSNHFAIERDGKIIVWGGKTWEYLDNLEIFSLDVKTGIWENHGLLGALHYYLTPFEEECEATRKRMEKERRESISKNLKD